MLSPESARYITTLGSLPYLDPATALASVIATSPSFPTWPQLSQRAPQERFAQAVIHILPGVLPTAGGGQFLALPSGIDVTDWDAGPHQAREAEEAFSRQALGYAAFRTALRQGDFGSHPHVKSPLPGPAALASMLTLPDGAIALTDPATCDRLTRLIGALAIAMARELIACGAGSVEVWLDEPGWGMLTEDAARESWRDRYRALIASLHAADIRVGLHCCAGVDFSDFAELGLDVFSFDAARYLQEFERALPAFADEIFAGRLRTAWGVIDTWEPDVETDLEASYDHWRGLIDRQPAAVREALLVDPLFTPACGLGLLTIPQAVRTLDRLAAFVQLFAGNM